MRRFRFPSAAALSLTFVIAACGGTAPTDGGGDDVDAPAVPTEQSGGDSAGGDASGDAAASVEVTVTGGEFEGNYSGSVPDGGCSRGATGENTFGLQYSTAEDVELSSVQLIVNDADAAAGGTEDFMTSFTFGDLLEGTTVDISPPKESGTGTVTVDDRGDTATITIEGETSDGMAIHATVECHSVFDMSG